MSVMLFGDKKLDRKLAKLPEKLVNKLLPKAAKKAAKTVKSDYQKRVPVLTGAMRDALTTKVYRKAQKKGTGTFKTFTRGGVTKRYEVQKAYAKDVGANVIVSREKLVKEAGKKKRGNKSLPIDRKRGGMYFYPAVVELGGRTQSGRRPLTKALYDNKDDIRKAFIIALKALV